MTPQMKEFAFALEEVATLSCSLVNLTLNTDNSREVLMDRALTLRKAIRVSSILYERLSPGEKADWHRG